MEKYLISADYDDRRIFFMKKDSEISRMFQYAGNRHWLTVLGMILAGLSTVLSMVPFVCIWFVVRDMLNALTANQISVLRRTAACMHGGQPDFPFCYILLHSAVHIWQHSAQRQI